MHGGEFYKGKAGGKVAHVRKAWYGLKSRLYCGNGTATAND